MSTENDEKKAAAAKAKADAAAAKAAEATAQKEQKAADDLAKAKANAKELPEDTRIPRANADVPLVRVYGAIADVVIDIVNNAIVSVLFVEAKSFTKDRDEKVLFIEGPNTLEVASESHTEGKFGVKADGSVVYNQRGLGESADWELVHIGKLLGKQGGKKAPAAKPKPAPKPKPAKKPAKK